MLQNVQLQIQKMHAYRTGSKMFVHMFKKYALTGTKMYVYMARYTFTECTMTDSKISAYRTDSQKYSFKMYPLQIQKIYAYMS